MCNASIIEWFIKNFNASDFNGKKILEVGSKYVNGSVRSVIEKFSSPKQYVGVDIEDGRFVDEILSAEQVLPRFEKETFDVVIATSLLEHVRDWRLIVNNLKEVLKPRGIIFITTVSHGFRYHGYPNDFWRYEIEDMKQIFCDFNILTLTTNSYAKGILLKALKPKNYDLVSLDDVALYSVAIGKRTLEISEGVSLSFGRSLLLGLRRKINKFQVM